MTVADRAAEVIGAELGAQHRTWSGYLDAPAMANKLSAAALLATDDELEYRRLEAEAERPDMQALADRTMRHVDAVNRVVEAAKAEIVAMDAARAWCCTKGTVNAWTASEDAREAAVRALLEEEE